jgi:serine/threonine protein kinase/Tol biopolymer transport system component
LTIHGDTQNVTDAGARTAPNADLTAGTRLGHYRVDAPLGHGGSGIVYRGWDTKLERPVAIKFLISAVADEDAQRRFKQEAATASSLRHPHIVTVYDVGEHDGRQYIVSELVEGGTLEDWARAAKRSWRQCIDLVTGVADALAAAHSAGVLHRDVKPGNILIDSNGYAKLADFGLAKLARGWNDARGARADSQHTRAGLVVGTVAYMSPEQATGQPLDARSDVFSFGIVLYELLAGRRPFDAANDLELLKAIAHATPAPLPEQVPELLRNAVDKALEKEPADRYQTMQDLVADLRRATRKTGAQPSLATPAKRRHARVAWLIGEAAVFMAVGGAAVFGALRWLEKPAVQAKRMQFTIPAPGYQINGLAISPDGTRIAYVSNASGMRQIWLRPIDSLDAHVLAGTEGATAVFWSPDSRYVAFGAEGKLKKLDVNGGPAQTIADQQRGLYGGTWSPSGTILYNATVKTFGVAPTSGGNKRSWPTQPKDDDAPRVLPEKLPDGDHFLYVSPAMPLGSSGRTLLVGSLATGESSRLADFPVGDDFVPGNLTATTIAYADGYVLYLLSGNGGTLSALPFDATALAVRGAPVPVAEHVAEFSVSATGVLVYRELELPTTVAAPPQHRLVWVDRHGEPVAEVPAPAGYRLPSLSPDGRRIALRVPGQNGLGDVWTIDAENGAPTRITFDDAEDGAPIWSPDGTQLAFNSGRKATLARMPTALYRRAANGAGADELLFAAGDSATVAPIGWSSDGRLLLFARNELLAQERVDVWALELNGERTARPIIESPARKGPARLSPNGRWLAYGTDETKVVEVVAQPFPDVARGKWQISKGGGSQPRWRGDGRELYYLALNGDLMAVDVDTTSDVLTTGAPHKLFATGAPPNTNVVVDYDFDAAPDGQRFLLNLVASGKPAQASTDTAAAADLPLHVIVNWTAGLRRP